MMKAEMASETRRSRAHTATTGSERAPDSFVAARIGGSGLPTSGIVFTFYRKSVEKIGNWVICNLKPTCAVSGFCVETGLCPVFAGATEGDAASRVSTGKRTLSKPARFITYFWYGRHRLGVAQFCYSGRLEGQRSRRSRTHEKRKQSHPDWKPWQGSRDQAHSARQASGNVLTGNQRALQRQRRPVAGPHRVAQHRTLGAACGSRR